MIRLWKPRVPSAQITTSASEQTPALLIRGTGTVCVEPNTIARAIYLRIGESLFGAEIGWMIFRRETDAVACSMDCPGLLPALLGRFGQFLEAAGLIDVADSATEQAVLRRARAGGVVTLDLPALETILSRSVVTGRGVRIIDLPPIG
jgi:hypothetical protein